MNSILRNILDEIQFCFHNLNEIELANVDHKQGLEIWQLLGSSGLTWMALLWSVRVEEEEWLGRIGCMSLLQSHVDEISRALLLMKANRGKHYLISLWLLCSGFPEFWCSWTNRCSSGCVEVYKNVATSSVKPCFSDSDSLSEVLEKKGTDLFNGEFLLCFFFLVHFIFLICLKEILSICKWSENVMVIPIDNIITKLQIGSSRWS